MILECSNCHGETVKLFKDKVSNKLVCKACMNKAIQMGIRYSFDFVEIL